MEMTPRGRGAAFNAPPIVVAATAVASFALLFRFLTFRGLSDDHYMHMGWAQQLLFGELPGRDFVDPGLPLQYALSAAVQAFWPGPFSEGVASIVLLALATCAAALVVGWATRSVAATVGAGLIATVCLPRLYSYPKVLVPAVTLLLLARLGRYPRTPGLAALALWTVVAALLRHDLGAFAALAVVAGLLVVPGEPVAGRVAAVSRFGVCLAIAALPYTAFVFWSEGLLEHLRVGNEFAKSDTHQLLLAPGQWPRFEGTSVRAWLTEQQGPLLFWLTHVLIAAMAVIAVRDVRRGADRAPVVVAALVFLVCYRLTILRHALPARLPDLAAIYAICGAIAAAEVLRLARAHLPRRPVFAVAAVAATLACVAVAADAVMTIVGFRSEVSESSLLLGPRAVIGRAQTVVNRGTNPSWDAYWPAGDVPPAIPYLADCTGTRDRLLTTWPSAEYFFFARRPFAAGHLEFFHRLSFSNERDQTLALERLERQYVPVVLINETTFGEFRQAFPMIADYIAARYDPHGRFTIREGGTVVIAVRKDLRPKRTFGDEQWPCDFESGAGTSAE